MAFDFMISMGTLSYYLKNPRAFLRSALYHGGGKFLPDAIYLKLKYRLHLGRKLHLDNPQTFNEKIQWLKLHNRKADYTMMVDKIEVKNWVAKKIGQEYIIPTLGVWDTPEEIDFETLPDQFVIKCNHDSGGLCICTDKSGLDRKKAVAGLRKGLQRDYFLAGREWPYKDIVRKVFAERYMMDESGYELKDYKIFCFSGVPKFIQVDFDRYAATGHKRNIYDTDWMLMDWELQYPRDASRVIPAPSNLKDMLRLAGILSVGMPFLRTDFYSVSGRIYFGECTFFPESGFGKFIPEIWDAELGNSIDLNV